MARFMMVLLFLISFLAHAGNVPQASSLVQTGQAFNTASASLTTPISSLASRVTLLAESGSTQADATDYHKLVNMSARIGSEANYIVTAAKTLYCTSITYSTNIAGAFLFGYADTAVTESSQTAPTTPIYYNGTGTVGAQRGIKVRAVTNGTYDTVPVFMSFPAGKYPFVNAGMAAVDAAFTLIMDCYEQ